MVYSYETSRFWGLCNKIRDYQGSITHLVDDSDGTVVAEYSYDPWTLMRQSYDSKPFTP